MYNYSCTFNAAVTLCLWCQVGLDIWGTSGWTEWWTHARAGSPSSCVCTACSSTPRLSAVCPCGRPPARGRPFAPEPPGRPPAARPPPPESSGGPPDSPRSRLQQETQGQRSSNLHPHIQIGPFQLVHYLLFMSHKRWRSECRWIILIQVCSRCHLCTWWDNKLWCVCEGFMGVGE